MEVVKQLPFFIFSKEDFRVFTLKKVWMKDYLLFLRDNLFKYSLDYIFIYKYIFDLGLSLNLEKNVVDSLILKELYKEKIHVARLRSEQMDSSLNNILSSVFTPTVAATLTLAITIPFELSEKDPNVINLPVYISGAIVILYMLRLVWIRRLSSKSEKEWTNMHRVLYFLENYKP